MTTTTESAAVQPAAATNPFAALFANNPFMPSNWTMPAMPAWPAMPAMPFVGGEAMHKALTDSADRMRVFGEEIARVQALQTAQVRTAIDESARLMRATVDYQAQLANEWRKASVDATQKAVALVAPAAR